jgi:hypothetical protein
MMEAAAYYDAKARASLGRPISQGLLLHMNYLNSLYLDTSFSAFVMRGGRSSPSRRH